MTDHVVDLLNAAKLVADRQDRTLLSYLIAMAIVEASSSKQPAKKLKAA